MKYRKWLALIATNAVFTGSSMSLAQNAPPPAGTNTGTAQEPGNADQPKQYKPSNPAPDPRVAPTSSPSGEGPSNGGRPEQEPPVKK